MNNNKTALLSIEEPTTAQSSKKHRRSLAYQEDYTKEMALHLGLGGQESLSRLKARQSAGTNIPEYLPHFTSRTSVP